MSFSSLSMSEHSQEPQPPLMRPLDLAYRYYPVRKIVSADGDELYLGEDTHVREVVIRMLPLPANCSQDEIDEKRAQITSIEGSHILPVSDCFAIDDQKKLVVIAPYCPHGSLADWVKAHGREGRLSLDLVETIVRQVTQALQSATSAEKPIVHGNVKPSQILIRYRQKDLDQEELDIQLAGFWKAVLRSDQPQEGADSHVPSPKNGQKDTRDYRAPEQKSQDGELSPATDQYALALIAHQLITGELPSPKASTPPKEPASPTPTSELSLTNPLLSPKMAKVLGQALMTRPQDRYRSISDFYNSFLDVLKAQEQYQEIREQELLQGEKWWKALSVQIFATFLASLALIIIFSLIVIGALSAFKLLPDAIVNIANSASNSFNAFGGFIVGAVTGVGAAWSSWAWRNFRIPVIIAPCLSVVIVTLLVVLAFTWPGGVDPYTHQGLFLRQDPLTNNDLGYDWQGPTMAASSGSCSFDTNAGGLIAHSSGSTITNCVARAQNFGDFVYDVQMTLVSGTCGGITFRGNLSSSNFYLFEFCSDQLYHFQSYMKGQINQALSDGSIPSSILGGFGQRNTIAVVARGPAFSLYANGHKLDSRNDNTFSDGHIGVFADTGSQVEFMNARLWTF